MRIAIVEDDHLFAKTAEKTIGDFFASRKETVKIRHCDGAALLEELQAQGRYDMYLLDVEMPEMDGLALAEKIHLLDEAARIVFLTSYEKYAYQSYRVRAYYYITKDSYKEELPYILKRICAEEERREEYYVIATETKLCKLNVDDILYLTKEKKYVLFHCANGAVYRERRGLENIYRRLPQEKFLVINRGIIVNMKYIVKYVKMEITMQDGEVFPVSRREGMAARDKLADYLGKML